MTGVLIENIKLVAFFALFALIGTILGLSHFGEGTPSQPKTRRKYAKLAPVDL